ncbi:MAG: DUF1273 family protein [Firmicutes bacterium]|nr:DUF1273 family protein [Bacillota bacterium]
MTREDKRALTCCFTGHRQIVDEYLTVKEILKREIIRLIESEGVRYFGAGGAIGFDKICSSIVLELREKYPFIKLILVLPCEEQDKYWNDGEKAYYRELKAKADKVVYVSKEYTKDCMFRRNRHLVDNSRFCVCYCRKRNGGTEYTMNYALERGLEVVNIYDEINKK